MSTAFTNQTPTASEQQAIFGGGCFWCTEAVFQRLRGVSHVESGYSGGRVPNPTYEQVCGGGTGHAEVIRITFDPAKISYRDLLEVFFATHDPTTPNRQGNDVGTQYRSVVFTENEDDAATARDVIRELTEQQAYPSRIVTIIEPLPNYFPAEDYHQRFYQLNPGQSYCNAVIPPKLKKLQSKFADKLA